MTITSLIALILEGNAQKEGPEPNSETFTCVRCWSTVARKDWNAHEQWCNNQPFPAYLYHLDHL